MKKIISILGSVCIMVMLSTSAFAGSFLSGLKVGFYDKSYGLSDVTVGARDTTVNANTSALATGVCYGPVFHAYTPTNWVADFIKICGLASASVSGPASSSGGLYPLTGIEIFDIIGLRAIVGTNANYGGIWYGIGISFSGAAKAAGM